MTLLNRLGIAAILTAVGLIVGSALASVEPAAPPAPDRITRLHDSAQQQRVSRPAKRGQLRDSTRPGQGTPRSSHDTHETGRPTGR